MDKIFIDTSLFIRFFTRDIEEKYNECKSLFERIEEGEFRPYTSSIVLLEIFFVLTRQYKFKTDLVRNAIEEVLQMRNLVLLEKTNMKRTLKFYDQYKIKFADCLIAAQLPAKTKLVTYDAEFKKIKSLDLVTPKDIINRYGRKYS